MDFRDIRKATERATANPGDDRLERLAYGAIFKEVARTLRKGSFKHGSESLRFLKKGAPWIAAGKSQLFQDVWALYETGYKRDGYFVEFGAASGVQFSNTWLLEKQFGWSGILAEPNPVFRASLAENRSCHLSFDCVWSKTGESLPFNCAEVGEHSGLGAGEGASIMVPTISLNDLLEQHNAPAVIDYISLDTEGSELEILQAFDFSRRDVRLISVEHNRRAARAEIYELMTKNGYVRRFAEISHYDDWYARA